MACPDSLPPASSDAFNDINGKPVLVLTGTGEPVATGRIRISRLVRDSVGQKVELLFETSAIACTLGISEDRLAKLRATFDGDHYTFRLPPGDQVWLGGALPPTPPIAAVQGEGIETYPLPENARLQGLAGPGNPHDRLPRIYPDRGEAPHEQSLPARPATRAEASLLPLSTPPV